MEQSHRHNAIALALEHRLSIEALLYVLITLMMFGMPVFGRSERAPVTPPGAPATLQREPDYSPNRVLVKFKKDVVAQLPKGKAKPADVRIPSVKGTLQRNNARAIRPLANQKRNATPPSALQQWYALELDENRPIVAQQDPDGAVVYPEIEALVEQLRTDPAVSVVHADYKVTTTVVPNDPYYSSSGSWGQSYDDLWGIKRINSAAAWDTTTGSVSTVIAVIDTGTDFSHSGLAGNLWTNPGETPGNAIDDDGNGYIDDVYGWDWVETDNDPTDDNGHGTHVAGTIAATGNDATGVVGVNWTAKVMTLRFLDSGGSGFLSDGAQALEYAADNGAVISNNSWGCACPSTLIEDAISYQHAADVVPVVAAGNSYADAHDYFPAAAEGAITVGALSTTDLVANFSNDGTGVDVVAPGVDILSLRAALGSTSCPASVTLNTDYCHISGTSMAAPHVAGLVGLMRSVNPSLSVEQIRQILHVTSEDLGDAGFDAQFGFGLIDAAAAVGASAAPTVLTPEISSPASRATLTGTSTTITGTADGTTFASYDLEIGEGRDPVSWSTITSSATPVTNGTLGTLDTTTLTDGTYTLRLTVTDTGSQTYVASVFDLLIDNFELELFSPLNLVSIGSMPVIATVEGKNSTIIDTFTVEYGAGSSPASYQTADITQTISTGNVTKQQIATWDTSALSSHQPYTVRLTVTATNGATSQTQQTVYTDPDLLPGWPIFMDGGDCYIVCSSTPAFGDLDADGEDEIIIGSMSNKVYAFNRDGTLVDGWPFEATVNQVFRKAPIVMDIDGDLEDEVIIAASLSIYIPDQQLYILESDGTVYPGWPNHIHNLSGSGHDATPAIYDLDGDDDLELILFEQSTSSPYHELHAYNLDGSELSGWPKTISGFSPWLIMPPTVGDVDQDGTPEIFLSSYTSAYMLNHNGQIESGWPQNSIDVGGVFHTFQSSPALGDLDGDGDLEIIMNGTKNGCIGCSMQTYAWQHDGTLLSGWPVETGKVYSVGMAIAAPAAADVDGDGKDEAIAGNGGLTVINEDGTDTGLPYHGSTPTPTLADLDGDDQIEFAGVYGIGTRFIRDDGSVYWDQSNFQLGTSSYNAVAADLNHNDQIEFALTFANDDYYNPNYPGVTYAYLWELPGGGSDQIDSWSMFSHDPARTGRFTIGQHTTDTTTPQAVITGPANGSTVGVSEPIFINAIDDQAVDYVELLIDGAVVGSDTTYPYEITWDTSGYVAGDYQASARAYDTSSNTATSTAITLTTTTADTQAPTAPTNLTQDAISQTTATISWNASTDNVGVTGYSVYRDGSVVFSGNQLSFNDSGLQPGTGYNYQVQAFDAAGNTSAISATLIVTTISDTTDPTVSIGSPSPGQIISGTKTISVVASDDVALSGVDLLIDGSLVANLGSAPFTYDLDTTSYSEGIHTITARAADTSGNQATDTVTVTIRNARRGDVNDDGSVNIFDLSIMLSQWNNSYPAADFSNNGIVDIFDLSILLSEYGS